jgi:AcrR family transcriptional regulator
MPRSTSTESRVTPATSASATSASAAPPTGKAGDRRSDRWREHREARRAELIAGVIAAVREHGASLGMDEIAAASGVAKPVYYRYFADKADLHLAVGQVIGETVVGAVVAALAQHRDPHDTLRAGIDAYLRTIEADPELYRFVLHQPRPGKSGTAVEDYATVIGVRASQIIAEQLRRGGLDTGPAEPWGFGVVGLVRSAVDRWLDQQQVMSREALVDYLTQLLWGGLSSAYRTGSARA